MRTRQLLLATQRETPAEAELISHQLMLKAGLIRKLGAGLYTWLPLGFRVLKKVETIIREEMNRSGAQEVLMPSTQPAELWEETGRWEKYGAELLRVKDRHDRAFCIGPTHEEVITDVMRRELRSYKQLPMNFYQIATKFRDEIRPRFGVMRAREFIMKDSYSFHIDDASLKETYQIMYDTYTRIFTRLGLEFRAVLADTGSIGGNFSHEFQVLAPSGEDVLAISNGSDYAANIEQATALLPKNTQKASGQTMTRVDTPNQRTIAHIAEFLKIPAEQSVKTLIVKGTETPLIALILRGDHELNPLKAEKLDAVAAPLTFATDAEIIEHLHCAPGSLGPVGINIPFIVDHSAACLVDFCCGANTDDVHYTHVNWGRDVACDHVADLRNVVEGDISPDGQGTLHFTRGIEVGHIFQLGTQYSAAMNATVLNDQGKSVPMMMGCYGIGVTRIVAAAIEQNHDEMGICWPAPLAPFTVGIVPINAEKSARVREEAEKMYKLLKNEYHLEVLLDDRDERAGVMFADMDLIGIPHRIVISERGLEKGMLEYKARRALSSEMMTKEEVLARLTEKAH